MDQAARDGASIRSAQEALLLSLAYFYDEADLSQAGTANRAISAGVRDIIFERFRWIVLFRNALLDARRAEALE